MATVFVKKIGPQWFYKTSGDDGIFGEEYRVFSKIDNAVGNPPDPAPPNPPDPVTEPAPQPTVAPREGDPNLQGSGVPYSSHSEAHGGWSDDPQGDSPKAIGGESIMAPNFPGSVRGYAITSLKGGGTNSEGYADSNSFVDRPGEKAWYDRGGEDGQTRNPTTSRIIDWALERASKEGKNKRPYKYTDFVFCKHFDLIPNNHMITLRRFPYPIFDNLEFPGEGGGDGTAQDYYSPIAQAITYMGEDPGNELSSMLKYSAKLKYDSVQSKMHEVSESQSPSGEEGPFGGGLSKVMGIISGGADYDSASKGGNAPLDPYNNGPYMNKIQGPLNRIDSTMQRKPGLEFTQSFDLKFHYVARPIGGMNTKAIMLDIMANLLTLTYAEAAFWGGSHRFTAGRPQYPFVGGKAGLDSLYKGDIAGYIDEFTKELSSAGSNVSAIFNSILDNPIEGLKSLAAGGAKLTLAQAIGKKKQFLRQLPALLNGAPVGEWHLTVGNPFNPMLEIGNLVCSGIDFEFGKELGPDDFPLEMTATIKLEHGMPRDSAAIQSMFNRGGGKIYHLPDDYQFGTKSWVNGDTTNGADVGSGNQSTHENKNKRKGSKNTVQGDSILIVEQDEIEKVQAASANSLATAGKSSGATEAYKSAMGYNSNNKSKA